MRVLVIGDSCQDVFCYCDCNRLAPEAPVPVLDLLHEQKNPGMAFNVYENMRSLNHVSISFNAHRNQKCSNIECDIETNSDWEKITKTRLVDAKTNQMFFRLDSTTKFKRIKLNHINFNTYDAVIISDYDKGFLLEEDIKIISEMHNLTFLDTKKTIGEWAKKITFIKINQLEYEKSKEFFKQDLYYEKLIKTLGSKGCEHKGEVFSVPEVEVKDVSGAGDTFIAGLVCNYLHSKDIIDSIKFANQCATEAVSEKGVVSLSKIKAFYW
tara:strand:- start:3169 stop:3972 length:804 start_codon:yes stop_codon:yes gene_type:complete